MSRMIKKKSLLRQTVLAAAASACFMSAAAAADAEFTGDQDTSRTVERAAQGQKAPMTDSPAHQGAAGIAQIGRAPRVGERTEAPQAEHAPEAPGGVSSRKIADQRGANTLQTEPLPSPKIDFVGAAVDSVAPLTPSQIRAIKRILYEREGAENTPVRSDIVPGTSIYDVDLSPGAPPPVVQTAPSQGALVNIIDSEGNPWPIKAVKNYNERAIKVEQMGDSTLSIESLNDQMVASVGVLLEGMSIAWAITVIPAQTTTDTRADLRMPGLAPGAVSHIGKASGLPGVGQKLDGYLNGGTPEGATRLEVEGFPGARAWQGADGRLVLRIAGLVSSPAWYERTPAADGTAVYELPPTPVVAVAMQDGRSRNIRIKGLRPAMAAAARAAGAHR